MGARGQRRFTRWGYGLVGLLALTSSGCIAAAVGSAVVAGGAAGFAYLSGVVEREYKGADFAQTYAATKLALVDFGMTITKERTGIDTAELETMTGGGQPVNITVKTRLSEIPADGPISTVAVRVGILGDRTVPERLGATGPEKPVSEKLLAQIGGRLNTATPKVVPLPATHVAPLPHPTSGPAPVLQTGNWTVPNGPQTLQPTGPPPLAPPGVPKLVATTPPQK